MLAKPSACNWPNAIVTLLGREETANWGTICDVGVEPPVLSEQPESPPASNTVDNAATAAILLKLLSCIALHSSDRQAAKQG